jgi:PadR family transcriptional regulator, regulatory protein PadR
MPTPASPELLQGTLDMMVLRTLAHGPNHGYGIARRIRQVSDEVLQVEEGSLYPALHRLAKRNLIRGEWRQSESNRRARYYALTDAGRKHLRTETDTWHRMVEAIGKVLAADREAEITKVVGA